MVNRTPEQQRVYYQANRERILARRKALRDANPAAQRAWSESWRERNPDRVRLYSQIKRNRRRAAVRSGDLQARQWLQIIDSFDGVCAYCAENEAVDLEHVVPLCRGGVHSECNVLPSCPPCNNSKGTLLLDEWVATGSAPDALVALMN